MPVVGVPEEGVRLNKGSTSLNLMEAGRCQWAPLTTGSSNTNYHVSKSRKHMSPLHYSRGRELFH